MCFICWGASGAAGPPSSGMPRMPREAVADGIYHVFARGNDRRPIYSDDADRRIYLGLLAKVARAKRWRCLGYCLMENHVHLLIETPEPNLALGMQRLQSSYAQASNARHRRSGHVFQGRYGSVRIKDDAHLWAVTRYVALNPVDAGLVTRPEHYPWSSHAAVLGEGPSVFVDAERLLSFFASSGGEPRQRYLTFVEDGLEMGRPGFEPGSSGL
jgi:putative transposase